MRITDVSGKPQGFSIKSANATFAEKQKNVFEQLNIAERSAKNLLKNEEPMDSDSRHSQSRREQRSETKHLRGRESIFKRPEAPLSKCLPVGRVPGFRKNPQKWTKYSLKDVPDMSEQGNTAAAMSFLKELEVRREKSDDTMDDEPTKIVFKKSAMIKKDDTTEEASCSSSFRNSKVIMPEYVVGQKVKKDKKNKEKRNATKAKQLKLDHLLDEEDEEC